MTLTKLKSHFYQHNNTIINGTVKCISLKSTCNNLVFYKTKCERGGVRRTDLERQERSESHSVERLVEERFKYSRLLQPSIFKTERQRISDTKRQNPTLQIKFKIEQN